MIPNFNTLLAAKGKYLKGAMLTQFSADGSPENVKVKGFEVELVKEGDDLLIREEGEPGPESGIYIGYVVSKIAFYEVTNHATWICSGPFSGCEFEIGTTESGLIYGAHIHMTKGQHMTDHWDKERNRFLGKTSNVYRRKITGPNKEDVAYLTDEAEHGRNPEISSFAFVIMNGDLKNAKWYKATCKKAPWVAGQAPKWEILHVERSQQETASIGGN